MPAEKTTFWCPRCGCELTASFVKNPNGTYTTTVDGCHCGIYGATNRRPDPEQVKRTKDCPPADALERTGVFEPPTN